MRAKSEGLHMQFRYSGERFRQYLQRNKISYKEAARILSIDKNTVGKAARGGNLKVDILLHICNVFQMDVTDFFCCDVVGADGMKYYISLKLILEDSECVIEEAVGYKRAANHSLVAQPADKVIAEVDYLLLSFEKAYCECRGRLETVRKEALRQM